jgi:hypothetical protein
VVDLSGKISAICGANLSAAGSGAVTGGSAVVSITEGVSIDMTGSPGAAGLTVAGTCAVVAGDVTAGAGLTRVAVAHALTYSVTHNKSQKEERCIAVKYRK